MSDMTSRLPDSPHSHPCRRCSQYMIRSMTKNKTNQNMTTRKGRSARLLRLVMMHTEQRALSIRQRPQCRRTIIRTIHTNLHRFRQRTPIPMLHTMLCLANKLLRRSTHLASLILPRITTLTPQAGMSFRPHAPSMISTGPTDTMVQPSVHRLQKRCLLVPFPHPTHTRQLHTLPVPLLRRHQITVITVWLTPRILGFLLLEATFSNL